MGTLYSGGRVVTAAQPTPECCFPLVEAEGVSHTALVPPRALVWMEAAELRGQR